MATFANQYAWLIGAFHDDAPYEESGYMKSEPAFYAASGLLSMSFAQISISPLADIQHMKQIFGTKRQ
jgi:hypothetical protein